jgi:hypothetical protein
VLAAVCGYRGDRAAHAFPNKDRSDERGSNECFDLRRAASLAAFQLLLDVVQFSFRILQ